jgi:hypothetical protein
VTTPLPTRWRMPLAIVIAGLIALAGPGAVAADDPVLQVDWTATAPASGRVVDGAAEVAGRAGGATLPLLAIDVPDLGTDGYVVRGQVRYADVVGSGYLEMWSVFADGSRYFTRTLGSEGSMAALTGTAGWRPFELPFYLEGAAPPERLEINVVLPATGTVAVGSLSLDRLGSGAGPASGMSRLPIGAIGAVVGSTIGLLAALIGVLVPRGRARRFLIPAITIAVGAGVLLVAASVVAALGGQPGDVVIALLLPGTILAVAFGAALPLVRRGYAIAELRKMRALDHV